MPTAKTQIIEALFFQRWDLERQEIFNPLVTLSDVSSAIKRHNEAKTPKLSDRNPANFFKDFIRRKTTANANWPQSVLERGYTGRQMTGNNACFEFVPLQPGQTLPFPINIIPSSADGAPYHMIETTSIPLASRRLGRRDEPWLVQVIVRQRVIETHLALVSAQHIVQVDHLQMSVKLARSEIDALFLAIDEIEPGRMREIIICCEAKGRNDDILEDQIIRQVQAVFSMPAIVQDVVIPVAVKALDASEIHLIEFEPITREAVTALSALVIASQAIYRFIPPVPGIGQ